MFIHDCGEGSRTRPPAPKPVYTSKCPKNPSEKQFYERATANGWSVTHSGWPDFFCFRDGEVCCVEVKPRGFHLPKKQQLAIMIELTKKGIPCYLWSPEDGFAMLAIQKDGTIKFEGRGA